VRLQVTKLGQLHVAVALSVLSLPLTTDDDPKCVT
jgi:hypothetical protein